MPRLHKDILPVYFLTARKPEWKSRILLDVLEAHIFAKPAGRVESQVLLNVSTQLKSRLTWESSL